MTNAATSASHAQRPSVRRPAPGTLVWAFVERQTNLWKRYWGWELVWLFYGVVNTLAITFIAEEVGLNEGGADAAVQELALFLLLGTLAWAYLSAVIDDISMVVAWERWEGTIEHTLMAPVPRVLHLTGMCLFAVLHALVRTVLIGAVALLFFHVDFGRANWPAAAAVVLVGSGSVAALAILAGVLPLIYPERGTQMTLMVQAAVLLVSGVYYRVEVLPPWLRVVSFVSPATYILDGLRGAVQHGRSIAALGPELVLLAGYAALLIPLSLAAFAAAERWAKRTGRLKRSG